jgi:vancomycin resistance protein VanJ
MSTLAGSSCIGPIRRTLVIDHPKELTERLPVSGDRKLGARRRRSAWLVVIPGFATWLYLAFVLAVWLLLWLLGDLWWFATVMLFAPRWIYGLPLLVLTPMALVVRRGLLRPLAATAVILVGPIMGICFPWNPFAAANSPGLRVLTCNIDGEACDVRKLHSLIAKTKPDIIALQECPETVAIDLPSSWAVHRKGQLLVASRYPAVDTQYALCRRPPSPWQPVDALSCLIRTDRGLIRFCNIHLQSPHKGLSEVLDRRTGVNSSRKGKIEAQITERRQESADVRQWLARFPEPTIIAGDFNMPPESAIFCKIWGAYTDAFDACGWGFGYTKWTPVGPLRYGARIDHILADEDMKPRRCWVGPDVGSDHRPLLAEIGIPVW